MSMHELRAWLDMLARIACVDGETLLSALRVPANRNSDTFGFRSSRTHGQLTLLWALDSSLARPRPAIILSAADSKCCTVRLGRHSNKSTDPEPRTMNHRFGTKFETPNQESGANPTVKTQPKAQAHQTADIRGVLTCLTAKKSLCAEEHCAVEIAMAGGTLFHLYGLINLTSSASVNRLR